MYLRNHCRPERGCCGWSPKQGAALEGAAHSWELPAGGAVCFPGAQRASSCLVGNLNCDFLLEKKKALPSPNIPEALALCLPWGFSGMVTLEMGVGGCHLSPVGGARTDSKDSDLKLQQLSCGSVVWRTKPAPGALVTQCLHCRCHRASRDAVKPVGGCVRAPCTAHAPL